MVIAKGRPWGSEITRPSDVATAASDAALAELAAGRCPGSYSVTAGDVFDSLGRPPGETPMARCLPMDLLHIDTDRGRFAAVAHVVAYRRLWRGGIVGAFNVGRVGAWDISPSSHPNDGRFEWVVVDAAMSLRHRLVARRRLPTGGHLPHPSIRITHVATASWRFARPVRCIVDGVDRGRITTLDVTIEPDAFDLIV